MVCNCFIILSIIFDDKMVILLINSTGPKMSLCQTLHNVLVHLTEFQYDIMGLSGFYVPIEALNVDVKDAIKDNYLIARLDREYDIILIFFFI